MIAAANSINKGPIKVAVLGGGIASLTTALELTDPKQKGRYDVTIYQLGWRLGGKCASGRDVSMGCRVQEHGLHVFFGFYDNTFQVLRDCYEELDRPKTSPFPTLFDALARNDSITLMEHVDGDWIPWTMDFPELPGLPGDPDPPGIWTVVIGAIEWILTHHGKLRTSMENERDEGPVDKPHWWERLADEPFDTLGEFAESLASKTTRLATRFASILDENPENHRQEHHSRLAELLEHGWQDLHALFDAKANWPVEIRRLFILVDLMKSNLIGILRDGLLIDPYKAVPRLNEMDYRAWMKSHGAHDITVNSAPINSLYDLIFAYPGGDISKPSNVEAGSMIMALMQLWRYRGSVTWKMKAGTGDVAIGPMFEVLKRRGAKVEFFSKVTDLSPSLDGNYIETVSISKQVNLVGDTYAPTFECNGLQCWPDRPLYHQIKEGKELKDRKIDLESRWTHWVDTGPTQSLKIGRDFDLIVLGISIDALHDICPKLIAAKPEWKAMMDNIATVQTQSVQLWFDKSVEEMGWRGPAGTILGAYDVSPDDTWADISEVLPSECWPDPAPKNESIICGPMKGPASAPPVTQTDFPEKSLGQVKTKISDYLENASSRTWPDLFVDGKFDWNTLHDPDNAVGKDRLVAQYLRANIDPTERYVQSLTGTSKFRLRTDQSGYLNLYLAGDWIANPQNMGSFEATVMSGKLASRAISGLPEKILRVNSNDPVMQMRQPPPASGSALPRFVVHGGMQTYAGPIQFKNVDMWGFFLKGGYGKLQNLCDRFFGDPTGGELSYVPLTDHLLVTIINIHEGRFTDYPEMGYASEKELAFWIYAGKRKSADSSVIERLGCFNPYLFLDNPVARMTGREVFGYLKQQGWLTLPTDAGSDGGIRVDAYGAVKPGPDQEWKRHPFIALTPNGNTIRTSGKIWNSMAEVSSGLKLALHADRPWLWPGLGLIEQLIEDAIHKELPQLFMKQFRDIVDGHDACYQAICEAPAKVLRVNGMQLEESFDFKVNPLVNIPIIEDLGIVEASRTEIGFKLNLDMVVEPGTILWKA